MNAPRIVLERWATMESFYNGKEDLRDYVHQKSGVLVERYLPAMPETSRDIFYRLALCRFMDVCHEDGKPREEEDIEKNKLRLFGRVQKELVEALRKIARENEKAKNTDLGDKLQ